MLITAWYYDVGVAEMREEEKVKKKPQHPGFPRGPPPWY
jgi:hypothetical protein